MNEQRMNVTCVAPGFIDGSRRKPGDRFSIAPAQYTTWDGKVELPSCVERDPAKAAERIREYETRPLRAALAACSPSAARDAAKRHAELQRDPNLEVKPRSPSPSAREQREVRS